MTKIRIYHNPRCSKSRQTLALLHERGIEPEIINYLENTPSASELKQLLKKLGKTPRELLRKGEDDYKQLTLNNPDPTDAELIQAMAKYPKLIERPIVVRGPRAVLGRPPEQVLDLIE